MAFSMFYLHFRKKILWESNKFWKFAYFNGNSQIIAYALHLLCLIVSSSQWCSTQTPDIGIMRQGFYHSWLDISNLFLLFSPSQCKDILSSVLTAHSPALRIIYMSDLIVHFLHSIFSSLGLWKRTRLGSCTQVCFQRPR